jgi:hypothetical protein
VEIILPSHINASGLLPFVGALGHAKGQEDVIIDFSALRRVSPAALVALVATVNRWRRERRRVFFRGLDTCIIAGYLLRMDAFRMCGMELPEHFIRHEAKGRFVPVRMLDHQVDVLGNEMASCVAPGGEDYDHPMASLYDLCWYVLTETANNVRQHSGGSGYAAAQVGQHEGLVRLAVADNGKGIRKSFVDAGLRWSDQLDDATAIRMALEPRISSRGSPTNEGVGLTLVAELAKLTQAWLLIVSGQGVMRMDQGRDPLIYTLTEADHYQGTLVALTLRQDRVNNYASLLNTAKQAAGLLRNREVPGNFQP